MKLEYLQKIITRIQTQIYCPKCKAPFVKDRIEVQGVKGHRVEFSAECSECEARAQISAEISGPNVLPPKGVKAITPPEIKLKRPLPDFEIPKVKLSPTHLEGLKSELKGFKGLDVKQLFEN